MYIFHISSVFFCSIIFWSIIFYLHYVFCIILFILFDIRKNLCWLETCFCKSRKWWKWVNFFCSFKVQYFFIYTRIFDIYVRIYCWILCVQLLWCMFGKKSNFAYVSFLPFLFLSYQLSNYLMSASTLVISWSLWF